MFTFTIFRIPVRVEPWFWLTGFLLGGGLYARDKQDLSALLLWLVVVFVSILVHELGHAITSRRLTGREPAIKLWAMGGLAYPNTSLTRSQSLRVTLAGPAAGLAFFVIVWFICILRYGFIDGTDIIVWNIFPSPHLLLGNGAGIVSLSPLSFQFVHGLVFVNFWWSLVNLLPVFPLDGGQAYAAIEQSQKKVFQVGLITGITTAIIGFVVFNQWYVALLFGYLAFQNYQRLQQSSPGHWQ